MKTYPIPLVPGPTSVDEEILQSYKINFGSADLEDEFFATYSNVVQQFKRVFYAKDSTPVIMSGEGMLALWGALKSAIKSGDKVLALSNGIFGTGIGDMAKQIGASVELLEYDYTDILDDTSVIQKKVAEVKPKMVTIVHCETPSGTLNPLQSICKAIKDTDQSILIYVDFVSSGTAVEIKVDEWGIDLGLLGTQKALSTPPDLSIVFVSNLAWKVIEEVKYPGYDALLPWKDAIEKKYLPYTHNWHAIEALRLSLSKIEAEGVENVWKRHQQVAQYCRKRVKEIGLKLYSKKEEGCSPTVTAIHLPDNWTWKEFDSKLRDKGVVVGESWGKLSGVIFRIGHMGSQANMDLVSKGLDVIEMVLQSKK